MKKTFIIVLALTAQTLSLNAIEEILTTPVIPKERAFHKLISYIVNGNDFSSILIRQNQTDDCPIQKLLEKSRIAIVLHTMDTQVYMKDKFKDAFLAIVCFKENLTVEVLQPFLKTLQYTRGTKTIFYVDKKWNEAWLEELEVLFRYCYQEKMLNALVVFEDFSSTELFFSYRPFPEFSLEQRHIRANTNYFPKRFTNLYGHDLLTLPDQVAPRTIILTDASGRQTLTGYIGKFIQTLAWKLNATLKYPYPVKSGELVYHGDMLSLASNGTLDIPASIVPMVDSIRYYNYSYPFEFARTCLMIPLANDMPLRDVFLRILDLEFFIFWLAAYYVFTFLIVLRNFQSHKTQQRRHRLNPVDVILNDVSLRGVLGQPFRELISPCGKLKLIYVLLFLTGMYMNCIFGAHLQTLLIQPPKEQQIRTFADTFNMHLDILVSEEDISYIQQQYFGSTKLSITTTTFAEFIRKRNQLDTGYAYPVEKLFWGLYHQQQEFFSRPLFIFSKEACFMDTTYLSFPLHEHSLFREALEQLILEIHAFGLIFQWLHLNVFEMVAAGSGSFTDPRTPTIYGGPLQFDDLQWIWAMFLLLMGVSISIFMCEIWYARLQCKVPIYSK